MVGRPPHRPTGKTPAQDHSLEGQLSHQAFRITGDSHEYTPDPHDEEKGSKAARKGRPGTTGEGAAR
jgi:hypothetical protein